MILCTTVALRVRGRLCDHCSLACFGEIFVLPHLISRTQTPQASMPAFSGEDTYNHISTCNLVRIASGIATFGRLNSVFVAELCLARTFLANESGFFFGSFTSSFPACISSPVPLTAGTVAVAAASTCCVRGALTPSSTGVGRSVRGASPSARSSICQSS